MKIHNQSRLPTTCAILVLTFMFTGGSSDAQHTYRDALSLDSYWETLPISVKVDFIREGMGSEDPRTRIYALTRVAPLYWDDTEQARLLIDPRSVEAFLYDEDARVIQAAISTYVYVADDQEEFERAVVERARAGGGPLTTARYASLLAQFTSDVAAEWLMSVAENDPDEEARFTAMSMMATSMSSLPQTLLPMLMEAIRSHDYFCHQNLTQGLPKFGLPATAYLPELHNLRSTLEHELSLPEQDRSVRITGPSSVLAHIDRAIAELERMAR